MTPGFEYSPFVEEYIPRSSLVPSCDCLSCPVVFDFVLGMPDSAL